MELEFCRSHGTRKDFTGCHGGPSAPWSTFARGEQRNKSAIPVGMTEEIAERGL